MTVTRSSLVCNLMRTSLLTAALVSSTAFAGPTNALFKATFAISESVVLPDYDAVGCVATGTNIPPGSVPGTGRISGSGHATHLGKATLGSQDCIILNPQSNTNSFISNSVVLQAANGDRLFAIYSGTATPQQGGPLLLLGTFRFIGGTGRFTHASGGGTLEGLEDASGVPQQPAVGTVMLSGTISY